MSYWLSRFQHLQLNDSVRVALRWSTGTLSRSETSFSSSVNHTLTMTAEQPPLAESCAPSLKASEGQQHTGAAVQGSVCHVQIFGLSYLIHDTQRL